MSDMPVDVNNRPPAELESILDAHLAELRHYREVMDRHQTVIDRLKAESKIITDRTDVTLTEIRQVLKSFQRKAS